MATIYSKSTSSTPDQCLVLGVREALVYPFDVGDWREIKIGYYLSMCGYTGVEGGIYEESVAGGGSNYKMGGYWGIKDSGAIFPSQSGSTFIGMATVPTTAVNFGYGMDGVLRWGGLGSVAYYAMLSNNTYYSAFTNNFNFINAAPDSASVSGTSFATVMYHRCVKKDAGGGKTGIYWYSSNASNTPIAPPLDTTRLRIGLLGYNFGSEVIGSSSNLIASGYLTSDFTAAGTALSTPNSLFIYLPLFYNRLRIFNIVIEKIS